jgi:hypothetical protein
MIEIIRATFFAGEVKTFLIQGEYVEILEAAYPIDVAMMDRSGAQLSTMRNAEASYFSRPGKYEVIQVTSSAAQTVRLFVGSGDAGTRRLSGDVSVIDGEKNKTIAGGMFVAEPVGAEVVGEYSKAQLWNPAGSGKNIIVSQVSLFAATAMNIALRYENAALVTDETANKSVNKKSNALIGIASVRKGSVAIFPSAIFYVASIPAGGIHTWNIKGALVITPGYGLVAISGITGAYCGMNIEWFEEAF